MSGETLTVKHLTAVTREESGRRRWTGLLATRLDRPELLELETKHVLVTMLGALIAGHVGEKRSATTGEIRSTMRPSATIGSPAAISPVGSTRSMSGRSAVASSSSRIPRLMSLLSSIQPLVCKAVRWTSTDDG